MTFHLEFRVAVHETRQVRQDHDPCKGGGGTDPQPPRQAGTRPPGFKVRLVGLLDRRPCALEEAQAGVGRGEAVGGAHQKADLKPVFQLRDRLGDCRLANADLAGSSRKRSGFHHPHEGGHRLKSVHETTHVYSSME
jgi:hypothetical protein